MNSINFNPFGHPVEAELPLKIGEEANWTEHYYFWCYDPETQYGIYIHSGRLLSDQRIWRPVVQIYLPDGKLLATTLYGADGDQLGPGAGKLKMNCIEPHRLWSVHFDGVAHVTSRDEVMADLLADKPVEPVRFSLLFEGAAPNFGKHVWKDGPVGTFHTEQICKVRGHFSHNGEIVMVNAVGARDHSAGPRDYGPVIGDIWFQCLFPDGDAIMVQVVHFEGMKVKASYYYPAGAVEIEELEILEHPVVADEDSPAGILARNPLDDADKEFTIRLKRQNGEEILLEGELLAATAVTLASPLEEFQGTSKDPASLQLSECAARVRWGDKVGYANRERTMRVFYLR